MRVCGSLESASNSAWAIRDFPMPASSMRGTPWPSPAFAAGVKMPRTPGSRRGSTPEKGGRRAALENVDVGVLIEEHCVARLRVRADADLVGHGARRHVDGVHLVLPTYQLIAEPRRAHQPSHDPDTYSTVSRPGLGDALKRARLGLKCHTFLATDRQDLSLENLGMVPAKVLGAR
jgi:hypothetical protein